MEACGHKEKKGREKSSVSLRGHFSKKHPIKTDFWFHFAYVHEVRGGGKRKMGEHQLPNQRLLTV